MQGNTDTKELEILSELAAELIANGRPAPAAAIARRVTELEPKNAHGWYLLGWAELALDEIDVAERHLQKALEAGGERQSYYRQMAELSMRRGDMKSAAQWCERAVAIESDSIPVLFVLAKAYTFAGDFEKAIKALERCLSLKPNDSSLRIELGYLYLRKYDYAQAADQFRAALTDDSVNKSAVWDRLGHALSRQGKDQDALDAFRKAVDLEPANPNYLYDLGDSYLGLGDPDKALGFLLRAIERKPDFLLAHYDIGLALFKLGQYEAGAVASQAALRDDPEMKTQGTNLGLGATNNLGLCLLNLGKLDDALIAFRRNARLFGRSHFNIGLTLFKLRRFDEAVTEFQKALESEPDDAEYLDLLGNGYAELGRVEDARIALERSIKSNPGYALAHYDLGTVLARKGDTDEQALKCFEKASSLDPKLFWSYYAAGCIHAKAGRNSLALELIDKALETGLRDFDHISSDGDLDALRRDGSLEILLRRYQSAA